MRRVGAATLLVTRVVGEVFIGEVELERGLVWSASGCISLHLMSGSWMNASSIAISESRC